MEDTSTDAMGTDAPTPAGSATTPPKHQSPIDQARGVATKVLGMITGRAKS